VSEQPKARAFDEDYFARTYGGTGGSYAARTTPNKWRSMAAFIKTRVPAPKDALDVGCAEGSFLGHALEAFPGVRWAGTDVSTYALERARARLPQLDLHEAPATALPFATARFDLVTAFDVLEHVPELEAAVAELHRVLRPGGHLVVSVPVYDGPLGWLVHLLDKDPTHLHKHSRQWWLSGALAERFELLEWNGAWRYYFRRYWHLRTSVLRGAAPAIVTAWVRRA
jgi:SAM-dependent methyltransferase